MRSKSAIIYSVTSSPSHLLRLSRILLGFLLQNRKVTGKASMSPGRRARIAIPATLYLPSSLFFRVILHGPVLYFLRCFYISTQTCSPKRSVNIHANNHPQASGSRHSASYMFHDLYTGSRYSKCIRCKFRGDNFANERLRTIVH